MGAQHFSQGVISARGAAGVPSTVMLQLRLHAPITIGDVIPAEPARCNSAGVMRVLVVRPLRGGWGTVRLGEEQGPHGLPPLQYLSRRLPKVDRQPLARPLLRTLTETPLGIGLLAEQESVVQEKTLDAWVTPQRGNFSRAGSVQAAPEQT